MSKIRWIERIQYVGYNGSMFSLGRHSLITLAVAAAVALSGVVTPVLACACLSHVGPACCNVPHDASAAQQKDSDSGCCAAANGGGADSSCALYASVGSVDSGKVCGCLHNAPAGRIPAPQVNDTQCTGASADNALASSLQAAPVQFFQAAEYSPPVWARQENPKYLFQCALLL